ncbi:MAG: DegT/DnrJ/EryC1/StrS family aminotransferase [Planctomycetales bacterium]|nr:DegT/DnrJ/EryC1/StrS family aminotransferase [Planctomycetales bacterium]
MPFIDLATQQSNIKTQIDDAIQRVLAHGKYIMGPEVQELEERLAEYVGVSHCISCSSGTDSLLIAMMALGIGTGDEVITVPYTWISTAEMIALLGAKPVFVDIDESSLNMDPQRLTDAITPRTRAIMPVGIYGQTANMTEINRIAAKHGIPVIEDAAQSFGATHCGRKSCALSTVGSTSFFPSKPLGCYGDGGALFTNDDELNERMKQIRVHGQMKKHHHPILGINGRLDTLQAAILLEKLKIFDSEIEMRNQIADRYSNGLSASNAIVPPVVQSNDTSVWAQYTILTEDRNALKNALAERGVPSVSYYALPLHLQPVFAHLGYKRGDFPNAEYVADHCLSLPMSPYLEAKAQCHVIDSIMAAADTMLTS